MFSDARRGWCETEGLRTTSRPSWHIRPRPTAAHSSRTTTSSPRLSAAAASFGSLFSSATSSGSTPRLAPTPSSTAAAAPDDPTAGTTARHARPDCSSAAGRDSGCEVGGGTEEGRSGHHNCQAADKESECRRNEVCS